MHFRIERKETQWLCLARSQRLLGAVHGVPCVGQRLFQVPVCEAITMIG